MVPQLGRFTLRDEGRTIAVGKVLKYKPAKDVVGGLSATTSTNAKNEESKVDKPTTGDAAKSDLVFDMDSGNTYTREEYAKIKKEREVT